MVTIAEFPKLYRYWQDPAIAHNYNGVAGIYKITCVAGDSLNGEIYIGQSYNISDRWNGHLNSMSLGQHGNSKIQNVHDKYGQQSFRFELVRTLDTGFVQSYTKEQIKNVLNILEQCYLTTLKPKFNICLVAGSSLGIKRSDEVILNLRAAKAKPFTLYHKKYGVVSGEGLADFLRDNPELDSWSIYGILNGNVYSYKGYYKCELYADSRKAWENDYPPNRSMVAWDDELRSWRAELIRKNHRRFIGVFELEDQAEEAIAEYIKKAEVKTRIIPYSLYNPSLGVITGEDLYKYCRENKLKGQPMRRLLEAKLYTTQGYYKSEEYYLDKTKWESDYPLPKSKYPHVYWNRQKESWEVQINIMGRLNYLGEFVNEEDAYIEVERFKRSIPEKVLIAFKENSRRKNSLAKSKEFELFHETLGFISGSNLRQYAIKEELSVTQLRYVFYGTQYCYGGYYKNEAFMKDKSLWEAINPIPESQNYPGVTWSRTSRKWKATPRINGKQPHLGLFIEEDDAIAACEKARAEANSYPQSA